MPKHKSVNRLLYRLRAIVLVLAVAAGLAGLVHVAYADIYEEKINALQSQNNAAQGIVNGLESQAGNYQEAITQLQARINAVQVKIAENQAQQAKLEKQIAVDQRLIDHKKDQLGADIKAMYIDGQTTTIEELASSKNLSDYVDKEEYRTTVQNELHDKIVEIARLKAQLQSKKIEVDRLLKTQRAQVTQLDSDQTEKNRLLSYNQGQQAAYNQQISSNFSKIASLRAQQRAANARFSGGGYSAGSGPTCGGGYPSKWCNAPQDSLIDDWGMYNRECVSYTAFKVWASGRHMPYWGGRGNANQWDDNARAEGIPMSYGKGAKAGDVAISNGGTWGHSMYVESVNGNGTINISQYNVNLDGRYSTTTISQGGLYFIHF